MVTNRLAKQSYHERDHKMRRSSASSGSSVLTVLAMLVSLTLPSPAWSYDSYLSQQDIRDACFLGARHASSLCGTGQCAFCLPDLASNGERAQMEFDAQKVDSFTLTIQNDAPDGQLATVDLDLASIRRAVK